MAMSSRSHEYANEKYQKDQIAFTVIPEYSNISHRNTSAGRLLPRS